MILQQGLPTASSRLHFISQMKISLKRMPSISQADTVAAIAPRGPLATVHRMDVHLVAEDHKRLLRLDKQGLVRNAEPDKVAALDMFERMALRGMGLVDRASLAVAHDADGRDLFWDSDSDLEVMDGLAFFKMSAFLPDNEKSKGGLLRSGTKSESHTDGSDGGLLQTERVHSGLSYADKFKCSLLHSDKSNYSLALADKSNYNVTDKSEHSQTGADKFKYGLSKSHTSRYRWSGRGKSKSNQPDTDRGKSKCNQPDSDRGKSKSNQPDSDRGKSKSNQPDSDRGKSKNNQPGSDGGKLKCNQPDSDRGKSKTNQPDSDRGKSNCSAQITTRDLMSGSWGEIGMMCDHCQQTYPTQEDLMFHMSKASHHTGSAVLTARRHSRWRRAKPRCIIIPGCVTIPEHRLLEVPVCPVCLQVFQQIADCVRHTYTHGGITGVFQLRRVNYYRTLTITEKIRCCNCSDSFPSVAGLLKHWHQTKHLLPVADKSQIMFFQCRRCSHYSMDYESMREHVLSQHRPPGRPHEVVGVVRAVYIEGPTPIRRLLPFFPVHQLDLDPSLPRRFFSRCQNGDCRISGGTGGHKRGLDKENVPLGGEERAAKIRRVSPSTASPQSLPAPKRRQNGRRNSWQQKYWNSRHRNVSRYKGIL